MRKLLHSTVHTSMNKLVRNTCGFETKLKEHGLDLLKGTTKRNITDRFNRIPTR